MPKIVACPNCAKKYKLLDSFKAKRVRCQDCNADFATDYDLSQLNETMMVDGADLQPQPKTRQPSSQQRPTQQRPPAQQPPSQPTSRPRKPAPAANPDTLAQMGISQIQQQPDLFSDDQSAGPDPLRNHVVQDPGFGNANTPGGANRNQRPSGAPAGDLDDVISNPYLADTGSNSVDARRKKAQKRKEEDDLLAGYKTSGNSLRNGRQGSEFSQNGINRTVFFFIHFVVNIIVDVLRRSSETLSTMPQANAGPASEASPMAVGVMILLAVFAAMAVAGVFYGSMVSLRFQNIRFKKPMWKKLATGITAAPWVCWALAALVGVVTVLSQIPFFLYIVVILAVIGLLALIPGVVINTAALALPPDYGIHKKLDTPAYIWIALSVLPLLIIILAIGYGAIVVLGNYLF